MDSDDTSSTGDLSRYAGVAIAVVILLTLVAALLRLMGLGARSLWLDEFCTWHVSQMGFWDSLRWAPELTIPPLYQLAVRLLDQSTHPPEWLLRMPALIAGVLVVPAAYWLGAALVRRRVGLALAIVVAFNVLQIEYSREARPYSMLVLGCTVSTALWWQLTRRPSRLHAVLYVLSTTLSFYAHVLTLLTVAAQVLWWVLVRVRRTSGGQVRLPAISLAVTAALITPLIARSIYFRGSIAQAVDWIDPPTWGRLVDMAAELTFGTWWIVVVCALLVAAFVQAKRGRTLSPLDQRDGIPSAGAAPAPEGLLLTWVCCAWGGLFVLSLIAPMAVTRYALPAGIPLLLLILMLAARLHRHAPIVLATLIVCGTAPQWLAKVTTTEPGFREMVRHIRTNANPQTDGVALVIERSEAPYWADMRRLALQYYPLDDRTVHELVLDPFVAHSQREILHDGRRWYLMVFRGDPVPVLVAEGRRFESFAGDESSYRQLAFEPYRLLKVAPTMNAGSE